MTTLESRRSTAGGRFVPEYRSHPCAVSFSHSYLPLRPFLLQEKRNIMLSPQLLSQTKDQHTSQGSRAASHMPISPNVDVSAALAYEKEVAGRNVVFDASTPAAPPPFVHTAARASSFLGDC